MAPFIALSSPFIATTAAGPVALLLHLLLTTVAGAVATQQRPEVVAFYGRNA
jgi:hypothetical protein